MIAIFNKEIKVNAAFIFVNIIGGICLTITPMNTHRYTKQWGLIQWILTTHNLI
jgi:hypothetical protein